MKRTILFITSILAAQILCGEDLTFLHYSVSDGLSHGTILSICQDRDGAMWFSSNDGISRFDGHEFSTYYMSDENIPSCFSDNRSKAIITDCSGNLWTTFGRFLSCYDRKEDKFRHIKVSDSDEIVSLASIGEGKLLVATSDSIKCFDIGTTSFIDSQLPPRVLGLKTSCMFATDNAIYIGTYSGNMFRLDLSTNNLSFFSQSYGGKEIRAILLKDGCLWIGTEGSGLFKCSTNGTVLQHYTSSNGLNSNYVRALTADADNILWVGTYDGLCTIENDLITGNYVNSSSDNSSLSSNSVRCLYKDRDGGIWLGTFFGGVNYWNPFISKFRVLKPKKENYTFDDNIINFIREDSKGLIWMCAGHKSISTYDRNTRQFSSMEIPESNNIAFDIKAICLDEDLGKAYFGAQFGGFIILDKKTGRFQRFEKKGFPSNVISLFSDNPDSIFVGTSNGLFIYGKRSGKMEGPVNTGNQRNIRSILRDSSGDIWIGGLDGIQCLGKEIHALNEISSVLCIFETSSGKIYVATSYGLFRYDRNTGSVKLFRKNDGLPDNTVNSIEEDSSGLLWISTNKGLCSFNPSTEVFHKYEIADEMTDCWFSPSSSCHCKNGELYFGSKKGAVHFIPETIRDTPVSPSPVIISLVTNNRTIRDLDGKIRLDYSDNSITIKYSTFNYFSDGKDRFCYKLENFDKDWKYVDSQYEAVYPNLPSGKYTFRIKAANSNGLWNDDTKSISFSIKNLWFKTAFVKIVFILLLIIFLLMIVNIIIQKKDKKHENELHQLKIRFFIDFLNELKNPLTLVYSPIQDLIHKSENPWMKRQLQLVGNNAKRLNYLVDQVLNYRRAELGVYKLHVAKYDIHSQIKSICSCYRKLAKSKSLDFNFTSSISGIPLFGDPKFLDMILNNLISNAFKFTEKGSVSVEAGMEGESLAIYVKDTGVGIGDTETANIFDRFHNSGNEKLGCGIGLSTVKLLCDLHHASIDVSSSPGTGTTFVVRIPQAQSAYSEEEKSTSRNDESSFIQLQDYLQGDEELDAGSDSLESSSKSESILLIETDEQLCKYLIDSLSGKFRIFTVLSLNETLTTLKTNPVSLILIDFDSKSINASMICSTIKSDITLNHIPVFAVGGDEQTKNQLMAYKNGADDFICKPFSITALSAKIQNLITTLRINNRMQSDDYTITSPSIIQDAMEESFVSRALEIIENNMSNPGFNASALAVRLGMSRASLNSKMTSSMNQTPADFIKDIRMKKACSLLHDDIYSIAAIGEMVGYESSSYFTYSFKKKFGMLPSEYKQINKNKQ